MTERVRPAGLPAREALEDRGVYFIRCRNLIVGAWQAEANGFIGIREKFGDKYLFTEYHFDYSAHIGTVTAAESAGATVPPEIDLIEGRSDGRYFRMNQPLFDFLKEFDDVAQTRLQREREAWTAEQESLKWRPQTLDEFEYEQRQEAAKRYWQEARDAGLPYAEFAEEYKRILRGAPRTRT